LKQDKVKRLRIKAEAVKVARLQKQKEEERL